MEIQAANGGAPPASCSLRQQECSRTNGIVGAAGGPKQVLNHLILTTLSSKILNMPSLVTPAYTLFFNHKLPFCPPQALKATGENWLILSGELFTMVNVTLRQLLPESQAGLSRSYRIISSIFGKNPQSFENYFPRLCPSERTIHSAPVQSRSRDA